MNTDIKSLFSNTLGIGVLNHQFEIEFMNESMTTEFELSSDSWVGFNLFDLVHSSSLDLLYNAKANLLKGNLQHLDLVFNNHAHTRSITLIPQFSKGTISHYFIICNSDSTFKNSIKELTEKTDFFETVLNNLPSDVAVFNDKHQYLFVNPIAISNDEIRNWIIGKDDYEYVEHRQKPIEIAQNRRSKFIEALQKRDKISWEEKIKKPSGETVWVLRNLYPVFNPDDSLRFMIGYGLDITDQKKQQEELIKAREEAIESQKVKQQFLAKISHEIRTPMNGVIGLLNLLEQTQLTNEQEEYLALLKDSSGHLMHLIDDILDLSGMQYGNFKLNHSTFNFNEILTGVISNISSKADQKNLSFIVNVDELQHPLVESDPIRIRQILINLLTNAIKFTHSGEVRLTVRANESDEKKTSFNISVQDTGIGIDEEQKKHLFEAFQQGNSYISQQFGGSGLGLSIVNEIIQLLDGDLKIESKKDHGSTFTIQFTLEKQIAIQLEDETKHSDEIERPLEGMKILIVDDHQTNRVISKKMVTNWGAIADEAINGADCLTKLHHATYDAILMDMQMPVMDGIKATEIIRRSDADFKHIPICAMTAAALPEEREKCLNSGMNDYLSKPFRPSDLVKILTKYWSKDTSISIKPEKEEKTEKIFSLDYLNEVCGDNEEFLLQMLEMYKSDVSEIIKDMFTALETLNFLEIKQMAHKAKSMAGYVSSEKLRNTFIAMENESSNSEPNKDEIKKFIKVAELLHQQIIKQLTTKFPTL